MAFQPTPQMSENKLPKGHLKCFQCRQARPSKEGAWVDRQNMQVFLCKLCKMTPAPQSSAKRK